MNTHLLIQVCRMILLTVAVGLIVLAAVYISRNPNLTLMLASIGWNG